MTQGSASESSAVSDQVSIQLLNICRKNSAQAAVPLLLAMFLTYVVLHDQVAQLPLTLWALASCTAILMRVLLIRVITRSAAITEERKRQLATLLTAILGLTISSVLLFFAQVGLFERAMLTAILLGLCTVSHSTNFGYLPWLMVYIGPMLGFLALAWIINPQQMVPTSMALAVGVSTLIVAHTLIRNGRFMFQVFALAIESSTKLEEQREHLSNALNNAEQAKLEAETSSQSKTRFIAAASHDLRQPVHVLNLFGGALEHVDLDNKTREIVDNMNIAVNSLSSQLNSLLDMSALDSGNVQPAFKSVQLQPLCERLMGEMGKLAEDKQLALHNEVAPALCVRTDPKMLSQVIRNLCGNAIKYTQQGSVTLRAEASRERVILQVVDTGIGIDSEECKKVFEEFYQIANPSRDKSQGLGLGLSIVERLIRALGHRISMQSSVGAGTTVSIDMPRSVLAEDGEEDEPGFSSNQVSSLPDGLWVHVVDDDPTILESIRAFLLPMGCRVTGSQSAEEALEFLDSHTPAALLVDLRMQGEDSGLKVIDALQSRGSSVPRALITGESLSDGRVGQAYPELITLQKPLSNDALLGLLEFMISDDDTDDEPDEDDVDDADTNAPVSNSEDTDARKNRSGEISA